MVTLFIIVLNLYLATHTANSHTELALTPLWPTQNTSKTLSERGLGTNSEARTVTHPHIGTRIRSKQCLRPSRVACAT